MTTRAATRILAFTGMGFSLLGFWFNWQRGVLDLFIALACFIIGNLNETEA